MEVINLNLIPSGALPVVHASQYDEGRTFRANLMDGSTVYTLDGTEVLECDVKKPDGNIVTVAVTNTSDSYVEIDTTLQMCACAGESLAELHITKGAQEIGTLNFILAVERSPLEGGIQSDSGIHNLQTQIGEAVADQYDAADVVFDAVPTAGHGVGFAVTSEGVKNAIPDELDDLSDVTYTGTPAMGEAVVWDGSKWTNGTPDMDVSDLADVTITTPSDDDILVYQNGEWVNMANPASTANFGADYDENTTYNTGDKCVYNNLLYECNDDGVTGAWDATKWDSLTVASMTDNNLPHFSGTPTAGSTAEAIGDLTTLTTTDKSSIVGAVNELDSDKADKSALTWTLLGETTGTAEQMLPSDWNELQIYGMFGGNAQYGFTAHAIKAHLGSNPARYIEGGADKDSGTDHHIAVWHIGSNAKIGLDFWRYNNSDYTSTSKLIVYYR